MTTSGVTGKRKRVSKNKKKSWRKHSDIKDVEEFMEDQRMQERTGGVAAEKTDEQLFVVEKKVKPAEARPAKRKRGEERPLKCHSMLLPDPRIRPVRLTEHAKTNPIKKKHPAVRDKIASGVIPSSKQVAMKQRKDARKQRRLQLREKKKAWSAQYDLWDAEKPEEVDEHFLKVTKKMKVKAPSLYLHKPSSLPAVEISHPGSSYNPSFDDHQELLQKALVVEMEKDIERNRVERSLDAQFPTVDQAPTVKSWLSEMGSGLFEEEDSEEESGTDDSDESGAEDKLSVNPPVRREDKKTLKQRRKNKERKAKEKATAKERALKLKKAELFRLKAIKKDVKQREASLQERAAKREEMKNATKNDTKKLGKLKYEAPSMEIKLSDELEGSLRLLKPEGHLLDDRFKSLQKRNIIEPRLRTKVVKKYKLKKFEKKSHQAVKL